MEIKTLSQSALKIIDQYTNFKIGSAICSIPYFNNKTVNKRIALRTYIGKGSPSDIKDELEIIITKEKINRDSLNNELLKKILVDNRLGIECSGFCYHVLETESIQRGHGSISKKIKFINCNSIISKIKCSLRPVENCDVATFVSDENSKIISIKDVLPGDIITMISDRDNADRNHILIIKEVQYENANPKKIIYSHSISYPEDGIYNNGVRDGEIEITNPELKITDAIWSENQKEKDNNPLFIRAQKSKTEIRRLNWF
jgi:hypothetical protein